MIFSCLTKFKIAVYPVPILNSTILSSLNILSEKRLSSLFVVLGLVFIVVASIYVYKTVKNYVKLKKWENKKKQMIN